MRTKIKHNFNIILQDDSGTSPETLTVIFVKELAKVSKEITQYKDITQLWEQQKHSTAVIANNSIALVKKEVIYTTAESTSVGTAYLTSGETERKNNIIPKIFGIAPTPTISSTASVSNTVNSTKASSTAAANTSSPTPGIENSIINLSSGLTTQTYAGIATQHTLMMPEKFQTNSSESSIDVIKFEIKNKLDATLNSNDSDAINYWTTISKAPDKGAAVEDFESKEDRERFTKMYFELQNNRPAISETSINNVNWEQASELMILKLSALSKEATAGNQKEYYNRIIKKIKNSDANIEQLFSEHEELFLLLKSVFPNLPDKITIQTQKVIYADLGLKKMYPDIGVKNVYFTPSASLLEDRKYNYVQNNHILKIDTDGILDGNYYTNGGDWLGNKGIDDLKVHVVNDGDYKSIGGGKTNIYKSTELNGVTNEVLFAFASVIHAESGGSKNESYAIGNVTMNFINGGGSKQVPTLDDAVMYDNNFAQGATQGNLSYFMGLGNKNSKFAMGAAINAIGNSQGISGFSDYSGGANGWDGIDLISSKWSNSHRGYTWSEDSKGLLSTYKKDNNGGVDVSGFTYKKEGYQISATKIIGNTIYTNITTGRGEKKQSNTRFHL